MKRKDFVLSGG